MKSLSAMCMIVISVLAYSAPVSASEMVMGEVLETKEVQNFTYMRLKTKDGEVWAAVVNEHVKKGAHVTLQDITMMKDFESKALKRVFPNILFGTLSSSGVTEKGTLGVGKYMSPSRSDLPQIKDASQ